jgi:nucleoside-diphosphate-sugar epimerase
MRKILVTGAAGYIGSILTRKLLEKGYEVIAFDILNFGGESLLGIYNQPGFTFIKGDIRNSDDVIYALKESDAVIHLASIVGDPACFKQPELANETNWLASKNLFDLCNKYKHIKRFIFASTCSNYGKMDGDGFLNEESPLKPVSLYAELKVKFEKYLLNTEIRKDFVPVSLRFSTAYGLSTRMRFDLTVNEFIKEASTGKELQIFGEQFWRPYCHVNDLARACVLVLDSSPEKVRKNVFGVGNNNENYQKKMIASEILKIIPEATIKYVKKLEDPRDYRVDFTKIKNELGFEITKNVPDGLREIFKAIHDGVIRDPEDKVYYNI